MKTNLVIDVSTLLYANFHAMKSETVDIAISAANMAAFNSLNYYAKEHVCDNIVIAFDGKKNWRKVHTKRNPNCVTHKPYKGTRRQGLTKSELAKLEQFDAHVEDFMMILRQHSGILVLHHDNLESDDLIAGFLQGRPDEKHVVITTDRDYLQLLRQPNVFIVDPKTKKQLTLQDYDDNADWFMFRKCVRGDSGDNVMSSRPYIREDKLKRVFVDELERTNMMEHRFTVEYLCPDSGDLIKKDYVTKDVFEENEMLMDLRYQPEGIRDLIEEAIESCIESRGKYDMFKFLKFCGKYDLQYMIQDISKYASLLKGGIRG